MTIVGIDDSGQPFFELYASTDVPGLFVCSLCGCLVKNGPTHTAWHISVQNVGWE